MAEMIKNVVLFKYKCNLYSVVVKGIENKIKEMGYNLLIVDEDLDMLRRYMPEASLFIAYLPEDVAEDNSKTVKFEKILEIVSDTDKNMILIGDSRAYDTLKKNNTQLSEFEWLNRPIDMEKFGPIVKRLAENKKPSNEKKRVLIVDDDPSYAKMIREWIKDAYRVDIVTAGMQAMNFIFRANETKPIDLILLDYEMPVVDGPKVLEMLREDPITNKIPVIFLTGIGGKEAVERAISLKPDGYILKSTSKDNLLMCLHDKLYK
ncbi:MAG: response regulator [Lachnospiraceae bacterium]|nr:response regulator [Lachnospiraceae bacterium]